MKALLLVANYDSGVGYAWWLMESFWAGLAEHYHRHNNVILAFPSISTLPPVIKNAPLRPVEQDFRGTGFNQILVQCRFLRRWKVKAVYFSDLPTWHWKFPLYRLCGVRMIVVHDHTPGVRTPPSGIKRWLKTMLHRVPWLTADGAIGATDFVRQRLIDVNRMSAKKCHAAPNGLPPIQAAPEPADLHSIFGIPGERKILVMTGRANRYKGVEFVLRCMAQLDASLRQQLHFLFIGDGPDLERFKTSAEDLGVVGHCTFAGLRNDIPVLLAGADIAIHPSKGEVGYSLSILEYMRAGLPVIVPDNPSVRGATEHGTNGLVYREGDIGSALYMIAQLLKDSALRDRLGSQAKISAKKYTLPSAHSALLKAFQDIDRKGNLGREVA